MSPAFARASTMLSTFSLTQGNASKRGAPREMHEMLRHRVERLWHPFTQGRRGPDLHAYRFHEQLIANCIPGPTFTGQVNGVPGGTRVLEDFFITWLCGFDVVHASVTGPRTMSSGEPTHLCQYSGFYELSHTRPFLGWAPSSHSLMSVSSSAVASATSCCAENAESRLHREASWPTMGSTFLPDPLDACAVKSGDPQYAETHPTSDASSLTSSAQRLPNGCTLVVPFTVHVEGLGGRGLLSHIALRTPVVELLCSCPDCPEAVKTCLASQDAMKMLVTLRRAGVSPRLITAKTLLSATKQTAPWETALGIF